MCNQNIISNKFDLILTTNAFFILVYSDFYEIPLPALRFEKVEETDTKWTTPKRMTPSKSTTSEEHKKRHKWQMTLSKEKQIHSQETTCKGTHASRTTSISAFKRQTGSRRHRRR